MKLVAPLIVAVLCLLLATAYTFDSHKDSDESPRPGDSDSERQRPSRSLSIAQGDNYSGGPAASAPVAASQALLNRIQAESVEYYPGESAVLLEFYKGEIGYVNVGEIERRSVGSIIELLTLLAPLTGADRQLDLEIEQVLENGGRYVVDFRQVIDGTPVDRLQRVNFDASGRVIRLSSALVKTSSVVATVEVLETEAIAHARQAVVNKIGESEAEAIILRDDESSISSRLLYRFAGMDGTPTKIWKFEVASSEGAPHYRVIVDSVTGDAKVLSNAHFRNTRVFRNGEATVRTATDNH